jgi:glucosyl-3-phosphoglycerate synthase
LPPIVDDDAEPCKPGYHSLCSSGDGSARTSGDRSAVGDDAEVRPHPRSGEGRSFRAEAFSLTELLAARRGRRISVCLPARDEVATVADAVAAVRRALTAAGGGVALVDEILVVDDGSRDGTGQAAAAAGARVVLGPGGAGGKGAAMAAGLEAATGDLIVFLDADVLDPSPTFVVGLLGPLLLDADRIGGEVALVKADYERPLHGRSGEGGRVTQLMAGPLLDCLFPELAWVAQPLAGETAAPREVLEKVGLAPGYGVELGLLLDVAERWGAGAITQVHMGRRTHRNRPLRELRPQATEILRIALERARPER